MMVEFISLDVLDCTLVVQIFYFVTYNVYYCPSKVCANGKIFRCFNLLVMIFKI